MNKLWDVSLDVVEAMNGEWIEGKHEQFPSELVTTPENNGYQVIISPETRSQTTVHMQIHILLIIGRMFKPQKWLFFFFLY